VFVAHGVRGTGGSRLSASAAGGLASAVVSVISDFTFAYAASFYDRSFEAVLSRAVGAFIIGCLIARVAIWLAEKP
jgi:hypothetical protein